MWLGLEVQVYRQTLNKPEPLLPFLGGADAPLLGVSKISVAIGCEGGQKLYFGVSFVVAGAEAVGGAGAVGGVYVFAGVPPGIHP